MDKAVGDTYLPPPQYVGVEPARAFEVAYIQHQVPEPLDLHGQALTLLSGHEELDGDSIGIIDVEVQVVEVGPPFEVGNGECQVPET